MNEQQDDRSIKRRTMNAEVRRYRNIIGKFDEFMCNNWTPENVHRLWNELLTREDDKGAVSKSLYMQGHGRIAKINANEDGQLEYDLNEIEIEWLNAFEQLDDEQLKAILVAWEIETTDRWARSMMEEEE